MTEFLIGFEFEFGWLPSTFPFKKPKSKPLFFEQFIFPEVYQKLNQDFPGVTLEIKEDCTLKFNSSSQKYWETHYGVEVVSQPMPEKEAVLFLHKFLTWLNSQNNIKTNKTCSLHLNINFISHNMNKKVDYWKLLDSYPQEQTLKLFNRQTNEYCQNSHHIKFGYEENNFISKSRILSYWNQRINKWNMQQNPIRRLKMIKMSFNGERYEISKQDKSIQILKTPHTLMSDIVVDLFRKRVKGMIKNMSIVHKNQDTNPYFEFRMIGNTDYHKRVKDILNTLEISKKYLLKSIS